MPLRLFQIVKDQFRIIEFTSILRAGYCIGDITARQQSESLFPEIHPSGDDRARTDNLRLARAALSQLSYIPKKDIVTVSPDAAQKWCA